MDRNAYKSFQLKHIDGRTEVPLHLRLHSAVSRVTIPIGWRAVGDHDTVDKMAHIRQDILRTSDPSSLMEFCERLIRAEAFLETGSPIDGYEPSDEDIRHLFSKAYHLLNGGDPAGLAAREVFRTALRVLDVGDILPERLQEGATSWSNRTPDR